MKSDFTVSIKAGCNNVVSEIVSECSRLGADLLLALDVYSGGEYDEVKIGNTEIRINREYNGNIKVHAIHTDPDNFEMP